jgi:Na+/melibiose symporter-like transporter
MSDMEVRETRSDAFRKQWWLEPFSVAFTGLGIFIVIISFFIPFIGPPGDTNHNVSPFFLGLGFICVFSSVYAIIHHYRKVEERRIDEQSKRELDEWTRQENERLEARLREVREVWASAHPSHIGKVRKRRRK